MLKHLEQCSLCMLNEILSSLLLSCIRSPKLDSELIASTIFLNSIVIFFMRSISILNNVQYTKLNQSSNSLLADDCENILTINTDRIIQEKTYNFQSLLMNINESPLVYTLVLILHFFLLNVTFLT